MSTGYSQMCEYGNWDTHKKIGRASIALLWLLSWHVWLSTLLFQSLQRRNSGTTGSPESIICPTGQKIGFSSTSEIGKKKYFSLPFRFPTTSYRFLFHFGFHSPPQKAERHMPGLLSRFNFIEILWILLSLFVGIRSSANFWVSPAQTFHLTILDWLQHWL